MSPAFPPSVDWSFASFNLTLPVNAAYFTARLAAQASTGSVEIRDARINIITFQRDFRAPFGITKPLQHAISLDLPRGYAFIEFAGNVSLDINGQTFGLDSPGELSWFSHTQQTDSLAKLSGTGSIAAIVLARNAVKPLSSYNIAGDQANLSITLTSVNSIVFTRPFTPGYSLTSSLKSFSPRQTLDGLNLFLDVSPGDYAISFSQIGYALTGYLVSLGIILGVVVGASLDWVLPRFRSRKAPVYWNEVNASAR